MAGRMMAALAALWISSFAAPALAQDEHTSGADFERGEGNDDFYCGERRLGQWFYCSKPKPRLQNAPDFPPPERSAVGRPAAVTRSTGRRRGGKEGGRTGSRRGEPDHKKKK